MFELCTFQLKFVLKVMHFSTERNKEFGIFDESVGKLI